MLAGFLLSLLWILIRFSNCVSLFTWFSQNKIQERISLFLLLAIYKKIIIPSKNHLSLQRTKENFDDKKWVDYVASCFCPCCVLIQMHRQEAYKFILAKRKELNLSPDEKIPKDEKPTFEFVFEETYCPRVAFGIGFCLFKIFCCWLEKC